MRFPRGSGLLLGLALALAACDTVPGPATPESAFQCVGLSSDRCQRLLGDAQGQVQAGAFPVRADIRCRLASCTEAAGEAAVHVEFSNGQIVDWMTSWEAIPP